MASQVNNEVAINEPITDVIEEDKVQEVVADVEDVATPEIQPDKQVTSPGAVPKVINKKQKGKKPPIETPVIPEATAVPEIAQQDDFDLFKINLATFPELYGEYLTDTITPTVVQLPKEAHLSSKKYTVNLNRDVAGTSQFSHLKLNQR